MQAFSTSFVAIAVVITISGCGPVAVVSTATTATTQVEAVPFDLVTHCGIRELSIDGKYYQRVGGPLTDGSDNPPEGWGNPYQHGTLSISGDVAVFRDKSGHVETFQVRPGAKGFLEICS